MLAVSAASVASLSTSADDFVAYDSLTEEVVMGWVHAEVDQSATEAALTANIEAQKNPVSADGMPW